MSASYVGCCTPTTETRALSVHMTCRTSIVGYLNVVNAKEVLVATRAIVAVMSKCEGMTTGLAPLAALLCCGYVHH